MEITSKNLTIPLDFFLSISEGALVVSLMTGEEEGTLTIISWDALLQDLLKWMRRPDGAYDKEVLQELALLEKALKRTRALVKKVKPSGIVKKR